MVKAGGVSLKGIEADGFVRVYLELLRATSDLEEIEDGANNARRLPYVWAGHSTRARLTWND
ncbi:MAG: hypothetical protein ACK2UK_07555 [Candidatus Promineifilaceae bacterium]